MVEFDPSLIISFETMDASPDILLSPSSLSPSSPASELSLIDTELHSSISSSTCPKSGAFAIDWEPLLLFEAEIINNNSKLLERDTDYINTSFLLARGDIGLGNRTTVTDTQSCDNFTKESETVRKNEKTTSKPISDITALKNLLDSYQNLLPFIESKPVSDFNLAIWGHIINDFPLLASKVPHVVTKLVHEGIPPALRGHIWKSFIFSEHPNDKTSSLSSLSRLYNALAAEWTPDLKLIAKDLYRSFPDVEIFKERDGPGQTSLGKVLRAYSAYDIQLGYCQGLAFLVGPLLMHMNDSDAFCALVKLMELSDLRLMFVPDMIGLQVKLYQFEELLKEYFPDVVNHFNDLGVMPAYSSKWFLSFFATTCPPCMLIRVFDLLILEGVTETLMRTALALIHKNTYMLLNMDCDEEILTQLLSQSIFDPYGYDGNNFVKDILRFDSVTTEKLKALENDFFSKNNQDKKDISNPKQSPQRCSVSDSNLDGTSIHNSTTKSSTTRSSFSSLFGGKKHNNPTPSNANDICDSNYIDSLSGGDTQSVTSLNSFEAAAQLSSSSSCSQSLSRRRSSITSTKTTNTTSSSYLCTPVIAGNKNHEATSFEDIKFQLEKVKRELEREKNNRRMDRFSVLEYLNSNTMDKSILCEQFSISNYEASRNVNGSSIDSRQHHRMLSVAATNTVITEEESSTCLGDVSEDYCEITATSMDDLIDITKESSQSILDYDANAQDDSACSYCDQLCKEIVGYKTDLAITKQTVEELKARLRMHANSNTTPIGKKVFSGSQPQLLQTQRNQGSSGGWNLWGNGS